MADRNGFFQLIAKEDGAFLHIYPAVGDGEQLKYAEVADYLSSKGISCDSIILNAAVTSTSENEIRVSFKPVLPENEMMKCQVLEDGMQAVMRFYPPSPGAAKLSKEDIVKELKFRKIVYGIREEAIDRFIMRREYCKDYVVAVGTPMIEGVEGKIEYFFDTMLDHKPAQLEDGSVDFFHLNTFCKCKAGQVLAKLTPEKLGRAGRNVLGEAIKPKEVRRVSLVAGQNVALSEDKTVLTASVSGHVELEGNRVSVSCILPVVNVDVATGNIDYDGNVQVQGNVVTGFSVKATGDVEVQGVVEGAEVVAGGNVIVGRGINGMGRGRVEAGGDVIARYIENANVRAGGCVQSGSVLHSSVSARSEVVVQGKRGFIAGGVVRSSSMVEAKILGSPMGVDTLVEVGTDPSLKERYEFLKKRLVETKKSIAATEPVIIAVGKRIGRGEKLPLDQLKNMKLLSQNLLKQKDQIRNDTIELTELEVVFEKETEATVKVTGVAYPGTRVVIADVSLGLKKEYQYCRFKKQGADVVMAAID